MSDPISKVGSTPSASTTETVEQTAEPKVKITEEGGKKVYRIENAIVIEGKIQKPNAFYVLQRSAINYEWQSLQRSFVPKIFEDVKKAPF